MEQPKTLMLSTPERTATSSGSFLANPKEVQHWIGALPTANIGETSRQVFKTLVDFNRVEIPNDARIQIAELFREPIDYISGNLRKYYYDISFPISAKNRKIAVLNRELYAELAIAYKTLIETMVNGRGSKFDRKLLIIAIHRALTYLGLVNYQSAIVYDPFPADAWREINLLYAFAEQNGIQKIPVKQGSQKESISTIADIYRQNLLFAVASPYRHRQPEIKHIFSMLPDWEKRTQLEKRTTCNHTGSEFVVQLNSDRSPQHCELDTTQLDAHSRILVTSQLVTHLRNEFDTQPSEVEGLGRITSSRITSKHLLRQMIQVLSNVPKREFVRTKLNFELKTAVGLKTIHTLLLRKPEPPATEDDETGDNMDWFETTQPKQALYSHEQKKLSLFDSGAAPDELTLSGIRTTSSYEYTQTPTWAGSKKDEDVDTFSCKTINESAGGYCVHWYGTEIPRIRVGEVIGIQSATNANQFSVGISRWMKNIPGSGLQIGLEMISPGSIPVHIREKKSDKFHRGLLLPELKSSHKAISLILSSLSFQIGDTLIMENAISKSTIRLTHMLESTGAFSQFQFVYESEAVAENKGDGEDPDNIWSML